MGFCFSHGLYRQFNRGKVNKSKNGGQHKLLANSLVFWTGPARVEKTWKLGKLVSGNNICFQEPGEQSRS